VSVQVTWTKGGEAVVEALDGDRITLRSSIPSAPGSPIEGSFAAGTLRVKVARCRRIEEGFRIEGRLVDATRGQRAEIERLLREG
jgi:hypothetical protein